MATLQDVVAASKTNAPLAPPTATSSGDIQDRFLKLLVTQLKNQDPLNPMDNAQLTSQLSQISTVTGIEKLNTSLQSLSSSLLSSQSLQATNLIGHAVYLEGNALAFNGAASASGGVDLAQTADSVKINIVGPAGNVVRQLDLGARQAGVAAFQWDGLSDGGTSVAAGTYSFQVTATSGGQKVPATALKSGVVSSITLNADGVHAIVNGIGDVPVQQLKRIM
jgi:flagellar basal-body rod modification protein FlgD